MDFQHYFVYFSRLVLVLIPFELGYILFQAKRRNKKFSLKGIILYRQKLPVWQYVALIPPFLAWALVSYFIVAPPIQDSLKGEYFSWLPVWFFPDYNLAQSSKAAIWATWVMGLIFQRHCRAYS